MVFPPLFGAEKEISIVVFPDTAAYIVGALGIVDGVAWIFPDGNESPREVRAMTTIVYKVPLVNPVIWYMLFDGKDILVKLTPLSVE
jgi:hypothetical protein